MINFDYLEMHLVNQCNLNCAKCSHYAPLAEPWFENANDFENKIKRLAFLLKDYSIEQQKNFRLRLMGGEPLLHPDILIFCTIARKYLPNIEIWIVTNGLLLENKDDLFFDTINNLNIIVQFTHYKNSPNYNNIKLKNQINKIKNLAQLNHGGFFTTGLDFKSIVSLEHLDNEWNICTEDNNSLCSILKDNKLYKCAIEAYNNILFNYFGINLQNYNKNENCLDFFNCDLKDITKFLNTKSTFCNYCNWCSENFTDWKQSKKEITEWVINY